MTREPDADTRTRRTFLRTVGAAGVGLAGVAAAAGSASAGHEDEPSVEFEPDPQQALKLPDNPAPMEAAVQTRNVYMPEGGWVVITRDDGTPVGRSMRRLPQGHFKNLKVATKALPAGEHHLWATIVKGESLDSAVPYMHDGQPVRDDAMVTFR